MSCKDSPNYIPVAKLPNNFDLNGMNIAAVIKEINKNN